MLPASERFYSCPLLPSARGTGRGFQFAEQMQKQNERRRTVIRVNALPAKHEHWVRVGLIRRCAPPCVSARAAEWAARGGASGQAALQKKNLSHQPRVLCPPASQPITQRPSRAARCRVASPAARPGSAAHARPARRGRPRPLLASFSPGSSAAERRAGRPAAASDAPTFGGDGGRSREQQRGAVKVNRWTPTRDTTGRALSRLATLPRWSFSVASRPRPGIVRTVTDSDKWRT
jgi:hypothetical protein